MTNSAIGNKRNKKIRDINEGVTLKDYVSAINSAKIQNFETKEVNLDKFTDCEELKLERQHCDFKVNQLIKNGILTWFGKFTCP